MPTLILVLKAGFAYTYTFVNLPIPQDVPFLSFSRL